MQNKPQHVAGIPGTEIRLEGATWGYFAGTSYLGLQTLPAFTDLVADATRRLGTHWGASREGPVAPAIYEEAEKQIARWTGSEAACSVSSGFLAGRLLADAFAGTAFQCVYHPACHAALMPAGAERARDLKHMVRQLDEARNNGEAQPVLFTDTIDFSRGPELVSRQLEGIDLSGVILVADDSHGFGVLGPDGAGACSDLASLDAAELIVCGSLGKALGITAGIILGRSERIRQLRRLPAFAGASPAPPAGLAALCTSLESGLIRAQRSKLLLNIRDFQGQLGHLTFLSGLDDFPVYLFAGSGLASFLASQQILVSHFRYSAESSGAPGRIVLTAAHTPVQLERLAKHLSQFPDTQ